MQLLHAERTRAGRTGWGAIALFILPTANPDIAAAWHLSWTRGRNCGSGWAARALLQDLGQTQEASDAYDRAASPEDPAAREFLPPETRLVLRNVSTQFKESLIPLQKNRSFRSASCLQIRRNPCAISGICP